MTGPASRRGFLSSLATLPLIGGSMALIGSPSAVAAPISLALVERYTDWLAVEYGEAIIERSMMRDPAKAAWHGRWRREWCRENGTLCDIHRADRFLVPPEYPPSARAALVLSAVGCDWRETGL
jgi:hypothetical protein